MADCSGEPGKEAPVAAPAPAPAPAEANLPQGLAGDVQRGSCKSGQNCLEGEVKGPRSLQIKEALGSRVVCKMPVLEGTPWEAGCGPGRLREPSEISCNGALGSAAALVRGERGRLYPKQGVSRLRPMGASLGLCDCVQGTPGGNSRPPRPVRCRHLPSHKGQNSRFLRSTPAARIWPALLPSLLRPIPARQQKSLAQGSLPRHLLHSVRCQHPKPAAYKAMAAAGWGRSRCQKPAPLLGLWVWERPKQGARDAGDGSVPRGAAALPLGAGASLS